MRHLARLVLTGFDGTRLGAAARRRLERLAPGGVVLFRRNIGSASEVVRLTRALREVLGAGALIAVDQEGGRVARLGPPFTAWPAMRRVGATRDTALARAFGRGLGRELAAAGFNCDLAPVLDVDTNPNNPVIGDRAFAADPALVARLGVAVAAGLEEAGVLPCGKHFPGHGDTSLDSHLALPVVARSRAELGRVELRPFRAAIRHGIPLLMTAHVVYPALDAGLPATLSPRILRRLLRGQLGYGGAVVSDDLAMHALDGRGTVGEVAVEALAAGCDWLLACTSLDDGECAAEALAAAAGSSRLPGAVVDAALQRVGRLRARLAHRRGPDAGLAAVLEQRESATVLARLRAAGVGEESAGTGAPVASPARRGS